MTGSAQLTFRVPMGAGAVVSLSAPPGYLLCPNARNPVSLSLSDFGRSDYRRVVFSLYPGR